MTFFRSISLVVPAVLSCVALFACGGATAPTSTASGGQAQEPAAHVDGGDADGAATTEDSAQDPDATVIGGDASPPQPACADGGATIVSCDYPGHTGERSQEVPRSQLEACGFTDCNALCKAENPGLPGVRCVTEEGTAKMYCTCLNP